MKIKVTRSSQLQVTQSCRWPSPPQCTFLILHVTITSHLYVCHMQLAFHIQLHPRYLGFGLRGLTGHRGLSIPLLLCGSLSSRSTPENIFNSCLVGSHVVFSVSRFLQWTKLPLIIWAPCLIQRWSRIVCGVSMTTPSLVNGGNFVMCATSFSLLVCTIWVGIREI